MDTLDHPAHALDREKQFAGFWGGQVRYTFDQAAWAHEDVTREDWFEVHESECALG